MSASSLDDNFGGALSDLHSCKDEQHAREQDVRTMPPMRDCEYKMMRSKSVSNVEGSRTKVANSDVWSDYTKTAGARPERSKSVTGSRQRHQAKIAQEERRELLHGWYDCEVVRRGKTHVWVKPLNELDIPEDVRIKLQDMNYQFRMIHEARGKRFCGGIPENVIYVATLDVANKSVAATALVVGMKVRLKLYTDNKGVGGYDVIPSKEHIEKIRDAIHKNFETKRGIEKAMHLSSILRCADGELKNVLFVGECTHAFSVAAGRLCGLVHHEGDTASCSSLDENGAWCSTELIWPKGDERSDLEKVLSCNLNLLRSCGIWCADEIDAHALKETLDMRRSPCLSFDTIFWMMPYVSENKDRPRDRLSGMMQDYILSYVTSATEVLAEKGLIAVVVTSFQCLSWRLCQRVRTQTGKVFVPEVWWFDVSKVEQHGYQSRFGDGRDGYADCPGFHMLTDLVIVCWRERMGVEIVGGCDPRDGCVSEEDIMERKRMLERVGYETMDNQLESEDQHTPHCAEKDISVLTKEVCGGIPESTARRFDDVPDVGDLVQVFFPHRDPPPGFQADNFLLPLEAGDRVRILHKEQEANTVWLWAHKHNCKDSRGWILLEWLHKLNKRSKPHEHSGRDPRDACVSLTEILERKRMLEPVGQKTINTGFEFEEKHTGDSKENNILVPAKKMSGGIPESTSPQFDDVPDVGDLVQVLVPHQDPPPGFQLANFLLPLEAGDTVKILHKEQEANTVWLWAHKDNCKDLKGWILLEWLRKGHEQSKPREFLDSEPSQFNAALNAWESMTFGSEGTKNYHKHEVDAL